MISLLPSNLSTRYYILLPDTPIAATYSTQRTRGPFLSLLDGQLYITIMAQDLLTLPNPGLPRRLFASPIYPLFTNPESHPAIPLPHHVRIAAVIRQAP